MNIPKVKKVIADPKFFPRFFRSKKWLKDPFVIPEDEHKRGVLYRKLEPWSHYCILLMPGYEELKSVLSERLKLLESLPSKRGIDIAVPPHLFNKEWRDGNFLINADPNVRAEMQAGLAPYADASVLHEPRHRSVQVELRARLAAFKAYSSVKG